MSVSVKKQILMNGIASILSRIVRIADQLLLVPFFLTSWGSAYYGEWLTLTIIPSVLAFADLGLGTAACNNMVLCYSAGNKQESADWYKTGFYVITASIFIGFLLSVVVVASAMKVGLFEKSLINPMDALWAVVLLLGGRLISFYNQLFEGGYRSFHKTALSINIATIGGLLKMGVGICVLLWGYGIVAYSFSQFCMEIIINSVYACYAIFLIKDLPVGKWKRDYANEIFKKGLAYLVSPLWQSIYYQGSTFVVRIVMGPEAVAVFNTLRTLSRSVNQFYSVIYGAVMPELQIAIGGKNTVLYQRLFVNSVRFSFLTSIVGVVFMAFYGLSIYNWWTKGQLSVSNTIWITLLIGIVFNAVWWTASIVFRAKNDPYKYAIYCITSAIVSVVTSYFLSFRYGILGAVLGYVLLDFIMLFLVFPTACRMLQLRWTVFFEPYLRCIKNI